MTNAIRGGAPRNGALTEKGYRGALADVGVGRALLWRGLEGYSGRTPPPLKAAPDAHLLDTTHLGIDAAFRAAVDIIEAVRTGRKRS